MNRKKRVIWRAAELDDAAAVARLYESPIVFGGLLQLPFPRASYWSERLAGSDADALNLLGLVGPEVVAHGYLGRPQPHARRRHAGCIGIAVHQDWHGRGIGSKLLEQLIERAERWMQMTRLELEVFADNAAAIAIYRKFSFVEEGRMRRYAFRDGEFVDALMMARVVESGS